MDNHETNITEPARVKSFARFFKNYMSIWSVVVAALPIPITSFNLIPVVEGQKEVLSTYTTLFCFLLLGFIFYSRHVMAKFFFPEFFISRQKQQELDNRVRNNKLLALDHKQPLELTDYRIRYSFSSLWRGAKIINALPLILIILFVCSAFEYHYLISSIITHTGADPKAVVCSSLYSTLLMGLYLGIFIFAEAAFILMAIKEYIQDLLRISDESLMSRTIKEPELTSDMPVSND